MILFILLCLLPTDEATKKLNLSDYEIFRKVKVSISPDGVYAFLDHDESQLVLVDKNGKVTRAGRSGQGPGEFQAMNAVEWDKDAFVIFDSRNSRLSRWKPTGEFLSDQPLKEIGWLPGLFQNGWYTFSDNFQGEDLKSFSLSCANLKTGETAKIWTYHLPPSYKFNRLFRKGEHPTTIFFPWDGELQYDGGSDFLAVTRPDQDLVHIIDAKGKSLGKSFPSGLSRLPVMQIHVDEAKMRVIPEIRDILNKSIVKPDYWPIFKKIMVDSQDRILVVGYRSKKGSPYPYRIFNRHGKMLGEGLLKEVPVIFNDLKAHYITSNEDSDDFFLEIKPLPLK